MAYDLEFADRIREALASIQGVVERRMFGGLAFLVGGHMSVVASSKGGLMIRADPATTAHLVETTHAHFAEMRGREMRGWLYLDAADLRTDDNLAMWIDRAVGYSVTLPPKS